MNLGRRLKHGAVRGGTKTPEYRAWQAMKIRCKGRYRRTQLRYAQRGIAVCERWNISFENFLSDMGPRPSPKHSLDRINNDGDYEPSNCRWATQMQQARNTGRNKFLEYQGERLCTTEWAERLGVPLTTIRSRLKRGWSVEHTLTVPVGSMWTARGRQRKLADVVCLTCGTEFRPGRSTQRFCSTSCGAINREKTNARKYA